MEKPGPYTDGPRVRGLVLATLLLPLPRPGSCLAGPGTSLSPMSSSSDGGYHGTSDGDTVGTAQDQEGLPVSTAGG